jgi:hypothetical protein
MTSSANEPSVIPAVSRTWFEWWSRRSSAAAPPAPKLNMKRERSFE